MAKVLLVEDDNNLREIYQARLQAEGYDIVSARDGEEALVVAKSEQPDLVISDVMMPKISGFEMLDILRNTEGLQRVKVIMLTALGQAEDQSRADSLGADRYLVKSQVTLEDIVNAAQELLTDAGAIAAPEPVAAPQPVATPAPVVAATPVAQAPEPVAVQPAPAPEPVAAPVVDDTPVIPLATAPPEPSEEPAATPLSMPPTPVSTLPDVSALQDTSSAPTPVAPPTEPATPAIETAPPVEQTAPVPEPVAPVAPTPEPLTAEPVTNAEEVAAVEHQIEDFVQNQTGAPAPEATPAESPAAVEPESTTPENTTPEQEQALNDALDSLNGEQTEAAPNEPKTPAEAPTEEPGISTHKKVIEPLANNSEEAPKKSLDELLAAEEAKEAGAAAPGTVVPTVEAPAESPEPATAPQPAPRMPKPAGTDDFDPNSIAL